MKSAMRNILHQPQTSMSWSSAFESSADRTGRDADRFTASDHSANNRTTIQTCDRQTWTSGSRFGLEDVMQPLFSVGQLVRMRRAAGGIYEVVRILPVVDDGIVLYVIRSEQGADMIVRQRELGRA
jgi:hypothetical protein